MFSRLLHSSAIWLLAALMLWSIQAVAQQDFTLTLQPRSPNYDTARVTVAFESSGISPGATITVGGGGSIIVPTSVGASNPGGTATSGEFVQIIRRSSTEIYVVWTASSAEFSGNWCSHFRTSNKNISISLNGVNATGYRYAGYVAPSPENCGNAIRRVRSGVLLSGPAGVADDGRLPLDVVLVIDKSGSMGWSLPGGSPGETRWSRLTSAVGQFMALWKQAGDPRVEGSDEDRVGLVFFNQSAEDANLSSGSIFKSRGAAPAGWANTTPPPSDIVSAAIAARSPGGSTSIGAGLQRAYDRWHAIPTGQRNDATILLFTDGEQNTAPLVTDTSGSPPLMLNGMKLAGWSVPILTIGLGAPTGPFADLLDQIGNETGGHARITTGGLSLDTQFADQLVQLLKGNTLSLMAREQETLPASGAGTPLATLVDGSVKRVTFVLGWSGQGAQHALKLRILQPDGSLVKPIASTMGDYYVVESVDIPSSGPTGTWKVQALGPSSSTYFEAARTVAVSPTIPYHLSSYAVEGRLHYRLSIVSPKLGTGKPVVLRAELSYNGKPLDKLKQGSIRVTPERPPENLGNILALFRVKVDAQSGGGDTQSPVNAKIDQLARTSKLFERITPRALSNSLVMTDQGNGVYQASFDPTTVGGQYRFRVTFNFDDPRTGHIERTEVLERQVPVRPTMAASLVQLKRSPGASSAQVLITPKDNYGNLVGPGYPNYFKVQLSGAGKVATPSDPVLTGTYTFNITGLGPKEDPHIKISFRGQALRDSALSQVETAGSGRCGCFGLKCP